MNDVGKKPGNAQSDRIKDGVCPKHIAVVMDGNGRWAKQRGLPRLAGHKAGVDSVREVVRLAAERGVEVLTLFAFSTENWARPPDEVTALMELFLLSLQQEVASLQENNVRLRFIGEHSVLSADLVERMQRSEQETAKNTALTVVVAVNYGGRWDILQAMQRLWQARLLATTPSSPSALPCSEADLAPYLATAGLPDPDLFIRTSGEQRISNFLNWQLAYTELYFTEALWPDFRSADFNAALTFFNQRERRFGVTSEQLLESAEKGD